MRARPVGCILATRDFAAIGNARWHPIYHVHGDLDELVPIASTRATVTELDRREYCYRFDEYAHTGFSQKDSWSGLIEWLAEQGARTLDPGRVTFVWYTADRHELEGYGPTGAWWVRDVCARDPALTTAGVDAHSLANPDPAIDEVVRTITPMPDAQPSPATRMELSWQVGAAPAPEKRLTLDLDNVGTLTLGSSCSSSVEKSDEEPQPDQRGRDGCASHHSRTSPALASWPRAAIASSSSNSSRPQSPTGNFR